MTRADLRAILAAILMAAERITPESNTWCDDETEAAVAVDRADEIMALTHKEPETT